MGRTFRCDGVVLVYDTYFAVCMGIEQGWEKGSWFTYVVGISKIVLSLILTH